MLKELLFTKHAPKAASPEDLAALEAKLSFKFPPAFVEFCSRWNGGFLSEQNEFYPVPLPFTGYFDEYGTNAKGVLLSNLFGATEEFPQCSLLQEYLLTNQFSDLGIIPIADDLFGNQVVLSVGAVGGLVYWRDKDLWVTTENPKAGPQTAMQPRLIPIAQNLEYFYNSLTLDPNPN